MEDEGTSDETFFEYDKQMVILKNFSCPDYYYFYYYLFYYHFILYINCLKDIYKPLAKNLNCSKFLIHSIN